MSAGAIRNRHLILSCDLIPQAHSITPPSTTEKQRQPRLKTGLQEAHKSPRALSQLEFVHIESHLFLRFQCLLYYLGCQVIRDYYFHCAKVNNMN